MRPPKLLHLFVVVVDVVVVFYLNQRLPNQTAEEIETTTTTTTTAKKQKQKKLVEGRWEAGRGGNGKCTKLPTNRDRRILVEHR